jgi:hypothetical protein
MKSFWIMVMNGSKPGSATLILGRTLKALPAEYKSADELNELLKKNQVDLVTVFVELERQRPSYPNVDLTCNNYFSDTLRRREFEEGTLAEELKDVEPTAEYLNFSILLTKKDPSIVLLARFCPCSRLERMMTLKISYGWTFQMTVNEGARLF